jgi:carbonic anhydrase
MKIHQESRRRVRAFTGTALAFIVAWSLSSHAQEFGYHDPVGPADWCGLSTDYEACCGGEFAEQSPIDINTDNLEFTRPLQAGSSRTGLRWTTEQLVPLDPGA